MNIVQSPAFVTAEQCRAWLDTKLPNNPILAQSALLGQLEVLEARALAFGERLAILELLRKPLLLTREDSARRFIGKPLPLESGEQSAFIATQRVWQALLTGYRQGLDDALGQGGGAPSSQCAVLIQRALSTLIDAQVDLYRVGYSPRPEHWRSLHELFACAERIGVAEQAVDDTLRLGNMASSPRMLYAEALLLHAACPYELPLRQLGWVARWARRWSRKVTFAGQPPGPGAPRPAICLSVDLGLAEPAGYSARSGPQVRWLDTEALRQSLKRRMIMLERGHSPAELQLGENCIQPACGLVLSQVYRHWCKGGIARRHRRQAAKGRCDLVLGIEAIHYYISGRRPFQQPSQYDDHNLRRERDQLATFGRLTSPEQPSGYSEQQGYHLEEWDVVEEWQLVDQSASGVHACQAVDRLVGRVSQGQLVAFRPQESDRMILGYVRWAMITPDSLLHAGILVLPGRPEATSVRFLDNGGGVPYKPAFVLPAIEALGSPASIVLPAAVFRAGLTVEGGGSKRPRYVLGELQDKGLDFERYALSGS